MVSFEFYFELLFCSNQYQTLCRQYFSQSCYLISMQIINIKRYLLCHLSHARDIHEHKAKMAFFPYFFFYFSLLLSRKIKCAWIEFVESSYISMICRVQSFGFLDLILTKILELSKTFLLKVRKKKRLNIDLA